MRKHPPWWSRGIISAEVTGEAADTIVVTGIKVGVLIGDIVIELMADTVIDPTTTAIMDRDTTTRIFTTDTTVDRIGIIRIVDITVTTGITASECAALRCGSGGWRIAA